MNVEVCRAELGEIRNSEVELVMRLLNLLTDEILLFVFNIMAYDERYASINL